MTIKIAINGLGRIGRCVVRSLYEQNRDDIELVAINAPGDIKLHEHLLKYDSVHGTFFKDVTASEDSFTIGDDKITRFDTRDPSSVDWSIADVVLECTGAFKSHEKASLYVKGGAKKVLISAPSPDPDAMVVYGVNNEILKDSDKIISIGSCTTNCLAPVAKVLNDAVGIESGYMTTIHAYTNDQNIVDGKHKDLRRTRAAAVSMIPTSTGAAKAIGRVLPELNGKLDGCAVRVPTPNVSFVDFTFNAGRDVNAEEINSLIKAASENQMKGVIEYSDLPLVSIDYNHNPHSSIFDATGTNVVNNRLVRIAAWYDNEWGFSCRMLDMAALVA